MAQGKTDVLSLLTHTPAEVTENIINNAEVNGNNMNGDEDNNYLNESLAGTHVKPAAIKVNKTESRIKLDQRFRLLWPRPKESRQLRW